MKPLRLLLLAAGLGLLPAAPATAINRITDGRITVNPLNIDYQFYTDGVSHRTAADPVIVLFRDKYYLFGSHCAGYYSSPDLKTWTYIPSKNLPLVHEWAPAVIVHNDAIYYMAFNNDKIYKSTDPEADAWEDIQAQCHMKVGDPSFFSDDNGKVYLIFGCSASAPIQGVELDPANGFKPKGTPVNLLPHNVEKHGWEVPGDNNERTDKDTWNEGPCLIKHDGKYYLQYATPGTEFTSYSTGVYVADKPLGPYTCSPANPFATKLTGFIPGAGHGHTFLDKYGNPWFVGSMIVSVREHYERRLGIFPVYFDSTDGYMRAHTVYSEFPFTLPDRKVDFRTTDLSAGMNLLSYRKTVSASSSKSGYAPEKACDERIKTWWSAATGQAGEWYLMDLGQPMTLEAVQVNLADEAFTTHRGDEVPLYQYTVEGSADGQDWTILIDRRQNTHDYVHELTVLDAPATVRYVRVTNQADLPTGCFSLYDLRLFGRADKPLPAQVTGFACTRQEDSRRIRFSWDAQEDEATRYVIYWGTDERRIDNAAMVSGSSADIGLFDVDYGYYCTMEAFNEAGIGTRSDTLFVKAADAVPVISPFDQTDRSTSVASSAEGLDAAALFDNDSRTEVTASWEKGLYFEALSESDTKISGYAITAGSRADCNPKAWELRAWINDRRWTLIDRQENVRFRPDETQFFQIDASGYNALKKASGYRLVITANHGGKQMNMKEWQLFGTTVPLEPSATAEGGKITDQHQLTEHEGVQYLIDSNADSKYCAVDKGQDYWMAYEAPAPFVLARYALTSANDSPGRDPADWTLEASTDGREWTEIDRQSGQNFVSRFSTLEYSIPQPAGGMTAYRHYRLKVSRLKSGSTFQLAEWQLFAAPDPSGTASATIHCGWTLLPGTGHLSIRSALPADSCYEVYTPVGTPVCHGTVQAGGTHTTALAPGLYVVRLEAHDRKAAQKVWVE